MNKVCLILMLVFAAPANSQTNNHYWIGKSTGKLPALAYGLGDDRLGGAKLGYIDTNVVLHIIDSVSNLYKIQLSNAHIAFIDKAYIKRDSTVKEKPFYLTNSWKVQGTDSAYDLVSISIDEKLPYKSWMEVAPAKIMVDLYGVQSNTNWITQLESLKEIKNIYYNQIEDDVVRITIELKHQQHWGYSINYNGNKLIIKVKNQPINLSLQNLTIAIDAGHGGSNAGAEGIKRKAVEKEYTLLFAKALQKILKQQKVNVLMTRNSDTAIEMKDRILFVEEHHADVLISLHLNSAGNTQVNGSSTYYKHIGFRPLSQAILKRMLAIPMNEFGNVGSFNFALNAPTDFVNCLLEIAFLSNEEDEKKIINPKFQTLVAKQIVNGLNDWLVTVKKDKL